MASVRSVNVGRPRSGETSARSTGIDKRPVERVEVRAPGPRSRTRPGSGLVGDHVGNHRHHGGDHQAVYAVAREELEHWERELSRELRDGMFGENLTTTGIDVDAAVVGQRWQVGDQVVLQVEGPRVPCRTFATHLGEPRWVRRFTERGRTGAYLSVLEPGAIHPGDRLVAGEPPKHGVTVPQVFAAITGDTDLAVRIAGLGVLNPLAQAEVEKRARRQ